MFCKLLWLLLGIGRCRIVSLHAHNGRFLITGRLVIFAGNCDQEEKEKAGSPFGCVHINWVLEPIFSKVNVQKNVKEHKPRYAPHGMITGHRCQLKHSTSVSYKRNAPHPPPVAIYITNGLILGVQLFHYLVMVRR